MAADMLPADDLDDFEDRLRIEAFLARMNESWGDVLTPAELAELEALDGSE